MELSVLSQNIFFFLLVLIRISTLMLMLPLFGERFFSVRIRLTAALSLAVFFLPVVEQSYPQVELSFNVVTSMVLLELAVGFFLGYTLRLISSALVIAGQLISLQIGLSMAQSFNPLYEAQDVVIGTFLALLATLLLFKVDMHHALIALMYHSFTMFEPSVIPKINQWVPLFIQVLAETFSFSIQIVIPFLVFGFLLYLSMGILSRLMPQAQVFFIAVPINVVLGLLGVFVLLPDMMAIFQQFVMHILEYFTFR